MTELVDYLNEDDGATTMCEPCASRTGLAAFGIGPVLVPASCEECNRTNQEEGDQ